VFVSVDKRAVAALETAGKHCRLLS